MAERWLLLSLAAIHFATIVDFIIIMCRLTEKQLPWIYVCGGFCTMFSMNWIGSWADRSGKRRVFTLMSLAWVLPILLVTNLPAVPLVVEASGR